MKATRCLLPIAFVAMALSLLATNSAQAQVASITITGATFTEETNVQWEGNWTVDPEVSAWQLVPEWQLPGAPTWNAASSVYSWSGDWMAQSGVGLMRSGVNVRVIFNYCYYGTWYSVSAEQYVDNPYY